jgi:surface carbohydrate biosynthesis protein
MLCALPIEIANRELDGMLYLALHLAARGHSSLIGEYMVDRLVLKAGRPVCYFDNDQYQKTNEAILAAGGIVLNINPEGLSLLDRSEATVANFAKVADYATCLCTWGPKQRDLIARHVPPEKQDMLKVTGHPSFDLVSEKFVPMYKNRSIIDEYGEGFILFNTNYGYFNHEMGCENYIRMLTSMKEWQIYATDEYKKFIRDIYEQQEKLIHHTIDLIKDVAGEFPDKTIIVRPHPSENRSFYTSRLNGFDNVHVINKGNVRSWLASAGVVVHFDCTTGMEAMLMGVPVIQFRPTYNEGVTANLMVKIGHKAETRTEVLALLHDMGRLEDEKGQHLDYIASFLANIRRESVVVLADLVDSLARDEATWQPAPLGFVGQMKCVRKYASKLLRARQPGSNGRKVRYALKKFPRLPLQTVVEKLEKFREIDGTLPKVSVEQICLSTFLITPRD